MGVKTLGWIDGGKLVYGHICEFQVFKTPGVPYSARIYDRGGGEARKLYGHCPLGNPQKDKALFTKHLTESNYL